MCVCAAPPTPAAATYCYRLFLYPVFPPFIPTRLLLVGVLAAERDEFASKLGIPAFGEDRPLPSCLLQWLAIRHQQANRHQASL